MNFNQTGNSTHRSRHGGRGEQLSDDRAVSPTAEVRRILISAAFQPDRPSSDVYGLHAEPLAKCKGSSFSSSAGHYL